MKVCHLFCDYTVKELQLLYAKDGEGFVSAISPKTCFTGKEWHIGETYEFEGHKITLDSVRESALYVTLFVESESIGHAEDEYMFVLSDELGNDYTVFPYEDPDANGYWFTKPEAVGTQLRSVLWQRGLAFARLHCPVCNLVSMAHLPAQQREIHTV